MSKSHSDGGFQCKLFLHINRSNEYINYTIRIPWEHFSGVSLVYRLSSEITFQDCEDGGDQLFVRAQAAAVQAPRPRPHQGDHATGQLQGTLSGKIKAQLCSPNID